MSEASHPCPHSHCGPNKHRANYQFGRHSGQVGRGQPGLCANSRQNRPLHLLCEKFAQGSWALLMGLDLDHCLFAIDLALRAGADTFVHTAWARRATTWTPSTATGAMPARR